MQIDKEFKVDYLQFSANRLPHWLVHGPDDFRTRSNKLFYTHMTRYANGAMMYEGNPNTDKKLFVLSGSVCDKLQITPVWMQSMLQDNGTVSRIDLAVTTNVNVVNLIQRDNKYIETKLYNKIQIISDVDYTPQTLYCGDLKKRGEHGVVRAYDKAFQLGIDLPMYRLEVEMKRKHATISAKRYGAGETIPAIMSAKFRIDRAWYHDIFGDDISTMRFMDRAPESISEIERKMLWLESQVLPSLQYVIDYDNANGTHNWSRLLDHLTKYKPTL